MCWRKHCHEPEGRESDGESHPWSPFTNIPGSGMPWQKVLVRLAANNWLKIRRLSMCCGNYNEPGC